MRIDLHTHSNVSDGTVSPDTLVHRAAAAGLDVVALTDHDTFDGWPIALTAADDTGVVVVPGAEISTRLRGAGVHVLGYLLDPTFEPLRDELTKVRDSRANRLARMTQLLTEAGLPVDVSDVLAAAGPATTIGRPHVADALVAKGYLTDRTEAFDRFLSEGGPAYVPKYALDVHEAVRLIRAAGGVAVLAHPWGRASRRVLDADTIAALARSGMDGIEVDHEDHSAQDRAALRAIAESLDLLITGSSDYHGTGKSGHELGVNTTDPAEYERLLERAAASTRVAGRGSPLRPIP
ncbi:MAG: PHP domain-containing protein [Jiangellaceae bacterium]|nr:PHP domain-containing protein [Jiangellaceae bacterium]